jgi:Mn2+/Fe2+ NRAMP family transporter
MAFLVLMATSRRIMGKFRIGPVWAVVAWGATALMAAASLTFIVASVGGR